MCSVWSEEDVVMSVCSGSVVSAAVRCLGGTWRHVPPVGFQSGRGSVVGLE